jgi:hypothetical protein
MALGVDRTANRFSDQTRGAARAQDMTGVRRPWWSASALVVALLALFFAVAAIGAREAARDARVLPFLDPAVRWIRRAGTASIPWLLANSSLVGWATVFTMAAIALTGLIVGRRRAAPLVLLAAAVSLAVWGQVLLLQDRLPLAVWVYGCGIACAVLLGMWCPMPRLVGFPELPLPTGRQRPSDRVDAVVDGGDRSLAAPAASSCWYPPWRWECALVFVLTAIALFTRTYALTELPNYFDLETVGFMVSSRTLHGIGSYIHYGLRANNNGVLHIVTQFVFFNLFGTSTYTVRLAAVFWGVAAIPLLYWLVRRIAGAGPAIVASILMIVAPEQLFWSRTENNFFADIAILALITVHLGFWMIQRLSAAAVLANALWMPFCRYFYTPCMVMFLYPIALAGHALLFVRNAWRKAWYAVPLLAGGVALWVFSFSILFSYLEGGWHFVDPANVYGGGVWTKQGQFSHAALPELIRLQAISMTSNLGLVLRDMAYRVPGFSHWCARADLSPLHPTTINLGLAVIVALGLGYLLGQFYERRAFALLVWVGLGVLPGILSDEPADRRIALLFPAIYVIAAVMLAAIVRLVRSRVGASLARVTTCALSLAVAGIAGTSLASHFLLPIGPTWIEGPIRFTKPLFEESDVIFHNLEGVGMGLVLGNLDRFLQPGKTPGFQSVEQNGWLAVALHPQCTFADAVYSTVMPPERVAALRAAYHPKRVSFLLQDLPYSRPQIDLLRQLFPAAQVGEYQPPPGQVGNRLVAITASISDIETLRSPSLRAGQEEPDVQELKNRLLQGVHLEASSSTSEANGTGHGIVIQGGLLLKRDGWYRFAVAPACADATFTLDSRPAPAGAEPMAAGVHAFEITLPSSKSCQLPLRVLMQTHEQHEMLPVPPDAFVGPFVASLPRAKAAPVIQYAGYGEARPFGPMKGRPVDFGVDAQGYVNVLLRDGGAFRVQRFDPQGRVEAAWQPQFAGNEILSMAVDPDGVSALMGGEAIRLADHAGKPIASWTDSSTWSTQMAFWRRDRILKPMQFHNSIALVSRDGHLQREWNHFEGGPGKFEQPVAVAVSPEGYILVIQADGLALLFQNPGEEWSPKFVRSFRIDFTLLPVSARTCVFDGTDRIVIANNPASTALVYNLNGERMIAADPARDLSTRGFGDVVRVQSYGDQLYVLGSAGKLWSIAH